MADTEAVKLDCGLNSLHLNGDSHPDQCPDGSKTFIDAWGFPLEDVYRLALKFYKDKEGSKALQLTYRDKLRMVALTKQVAHGRYRPDASPEVGFLDVVGNDRRQAWQGLGELTREQSMEEFVSTLDRLCSLFKAYTQAHKAEKEEHQRKLREEEEQMKREEEEAERRKVEEEVHLQQQQETGKQRLQEEQIRQALNQQTSIQFKQYAEQQFPADEQQQQTLIAQLQEQHFQQYMQQVYQQQLIHQQQQYQQLQAMQATPKEVPPPMGGVDTSARVEFSTETVPDLTAPPPLPPLPLINGDVLQSQGAEEAQDEDANGELNDLPPIAAASMWTRKDVRDFKDSIRKDPDSVIKVGSGETVTVRVPTHEDGTCLFWEFATDSYDIGFGVYFEWTIAPSNQVSVHVSESSDEEDLDEDEAAGAARAEEKGDIEKGGDAKRSNHPPTDEIIPVYRRDCHEEVYCGSHMYPGRGVYLLKFDNSYSLWRSKTLYYRVYYTR